MRVHARHVSLELRDQVWSIGLGRGAYAPVDHLDRSSYLGVAIEEMQSRLGTQPVKQTTPTNPKSGSSGGVSQRGQWGERFPGPLLRISGKGHPCDRSLTIGTAVLRILTIAAVILPLAIDTFVLSTALGVAGLAKRERFRTSLILTTFEAGIPVVGFLVGTGLGSIIGQWADYIAAAVLAVTGVWMLWPRGGEVEAEEQKVRLLESARGWAILLLGLSISLDELAIGLGVGLLRLPLILPITLMAVQAFLAAQLGMRLGSRIAEKAREAAEKFAGVILLVAAALVAVETPLKT